MPRPKKRTSPDDGSGPAPKNTLDAGAESILEQPADTAQQRIPAYVVLLITRYGMPRRKVYLDLGHARRAVQRAHAKSQPAELVLCKLEPVTTDLDGEVAE
jgi:hypothetical protein